MGTSIMMLVAAIIVAAAMGFILTWFFKRLRRIEEERWGNKV
jgi:uncharacterized protein HemY